jgi:hypothetical protein
MIYSQIWQNPLLDDCQSTNLTNLNKETLMKFSVSFGGEFLHCGNKTNCPVCTSTKFFYWGQKIMAPSCHISREKKGLNSPNHKAGMF